MCMLYIVLLPLPRLENCLLLFLICRDNDTQTTICVNNKYFYQFHNYLSSLYFAWKGSETTWLKPFLLDVGCDVTKYQITVHHYRTLYACLWLPSPFSTHRSTCCNEAFDLALAGLNSMCHKVAARSVLQKLQSEHVGRRISSHELRTTNNRINILQPHCEPEGKSFTFD